YALAEMGFRMEARIAQSTAGISETLSAYATKEFAEAKKTEAITAAVEDSVAAINTTLTTYATKTYAQSQANSALSAAINDAEARVDDERDARVSADGTLAARASLHVNA